VISLAIRGAADAAIFVKVAERLSFGFVLIAAAAKVAVSKH
jgi:hypothetical protein